MTGTTDALLAGAIKSGAIKNYNFNAAPSPAHSTILEASATADAVAHDTACVALDLPRITSQIPADTRRATFITAAEPSTPVTHWLVVFNAVDETQAKAVFDDANVHANAELLIYATTTVATASIDCMMIPPQGAQMTYESSADITSIYIVPIRNGTFTGSDAAMMQVLLQGASAP